MPLSPAQTFQTHDIAHDEPQDYLWTLNFGPQPPATHTTLRIVLKLDGERVVEREKRLQEPGHLRWAHRRERRGRTPGVASGWLAGRDAARLADPVDRDCGDRRVDRRPAPAHSPR